MERKDNRITIRLTNSEMEQLNSKIAAAGYSSTGAFIRDSVATGNIKAKIRTDVITIARELVALYTMIKAERPKTELLDKVRAISTVNTGGVL